MIISDLHLHLETWKGGSWMCQQVKETKTGTFQNYFVRFVLRYQTILFSFQYRSEIDYWLRYEILRPPKVEIHRSLLSMVLASVNNNTLLYMPTYFDFIMIWLISAMPLNCWQYNSILWAGSSFNFPRCWIVEVLNCCGVKLLRRWIIEVLNCWDVKLLRC